MKDLDPIAFTVELGRFYEQSRVNGTVSVTMKRMTERRLLKASRVKKEIPKGGETILDKNSMKDDDIEFPCLVRATYKSSKISTIVPPNELEKFQNAYSTVIRAYMDSLKKKERTRKKAKTATSTQEKQ
ncbi:signal recognition particle, SRP9/SRP14 subunit [Zychaea mexicana]|uniref:signal recognition particle, SRP9/SRP14 subunit n=1 Tax=Zychaea mexicana TaxID=64656 RepID=UPI0022FE762D|nr:signal recognition particle, SRP9/SRP14 subunit [Zychaea mexicana]KAI9489160.1 signal recognition particle, SRP9/SRP14 subunit [Zychaea mexicana]